MEQVCHLRHADRSAEYSQEHHAVLAQWQKVYDAALVAYRSASPPLAPGSRVELGSRLLSQGKAVRPVEHLPRSENGGGLLS
jgi:hypothetical protein